MNMRVEFKELSEEVGSERPVKRDQWWICIAEEDLETKLRTVFDAAKSAGHELDIMFTAEPT